MSKRVGDEVYHSARWRTLRKRVLAEEPLCRRCGAVAVLVDHIIPIADGGAKWDRANLRPLCDPCHPRNPKRERVCWHGYPVRECAICSEAEGGVREDFDAKDGAKGAKI